MSNARWGLIVLATAALVLAAGGAAYAFHSGGVAECEGCHSMHSATGNHLLIGTDPSSTCLGCHEREGDTGPSSYHISTHESDMPAGVPPKQRTPGGDFGWLKKTYVFNVRGTWTTEEGQVKGHNIVAADKGYLADTRPDRAVSPGGSFPGDQLSCISCHDPHGKFRRLSSGAIATSGAPILGSGSYPPSSTAVFTEPPAAGTAVGVYRLLAGNGYTKSGVTFPGNPAAKVPSTYNRTEASTQTRVAYGKGTTSGHATWGAWCGTCHTAMHSNGALVHKVDQSLGSYATIYGAYVNSSNTTGGNFNQSYLSLVPFVQNTGNYATLQNYATNNGGGVSSNGPASDDMVSCVSCHRAHASGWNEMLRWNYGYEFTTYMAGGVAVWPGTDTVGVNSGNIHLGRTSTETAAAYYDRNVSVFGPMQRVLCNKCHAKD